MANAPHLVTLPELRERFGVPFSKSHLYRLERSGKFPARVKIAARRVAWDEAAVIAWVQRQISVQGTV